jgi:2-polyprenyl-3-methyl-5-hydroxy-6-metoxy-1,4-benzoquinol methylase
LQWGEYFVTHDESFIQPFPIAQEKWPEHDLEPTNSCPMCNSEQRVLEYIGVKDWVFDCAPGEWNYWRCKSCDSLYVDPRPSETSIGRAYAKYYTHTNAQREKRSLRDRTIHLAVALKHGFLDTQFDTKLLGSIALPRLFYRVLGKLELLPRIFLQDISWSKPGCMLDLGCGNGKSMLVAKRFGWDVVGIELDSAAVESARGQGLDVRPGSYKSIVDLKKKFDLVVCSHVIEHVHHPRELLSLALSTLEDGGQLWLQWPNPKADGLKRYGIYWRGLEAPRHVCLPSYDSVKHFAESLGPSLFVVDDKSLFWKWAQMSAYESSENIRKNAESKSAAGGFSFFRAIFRFVLSKNKIAECELCTVTIKKIFPECQI